MLCTDSNFATTTINSFFINDIKKITACNIQDKPWWENPLCKRLIKEKFSQNLESIKKTIDTKITTYPKLAVFRDLLLALITCLQTSQSVLNLYSLFCSNKSVTEINSDIKNQYLSTTPSKADKLIGYSSNERQNFSKPKVAKLLGPDEPVGQQSKQREPITP